MHKSMLKNTEDYLDEMKMKYPSLYNEWEEHLDDMNEQMKEQMQSVEAV